MYHPSTILVSDTALPAVAGAGTMRKSTRDISKLVESLEDTFNVECEGITRAHWNRDQGELGVSASYSGRVLTDIGVEYIKTFSLEENTTTTLMAASEK
jgi:hypothetical protein